MRTEDMKNREELMLNCPLKPKSGLSGPHAVERGLEVQRSFALLRMTKGILVCRNSYGLKYGSFAMRMNAASDAGDELMRQSASLLMSNHTTTLDEREAGAQRGDDLVDPFALVSASFGGRHLPNDDRFFLRCKQRVDVFEHLLEGLPASILRAPVVPIDPSPIDVRITGVVVHGRPVASGGIGDVRTPRPNHVGRAGGNEEVVNVPISGNV